MNATDRVEWGAAYAYVYALRFFTPRQTEVSIYIVALGFLLTLFLHPGLSEMFGTLVKVSAGDTSFVDIFLLLCIAAIGLAVYPRKLPGQDFIVTYVFAGATFLMGLEYAQAAFAGGGALALFFGLYHWGVISFVLLEYSMRRLSSDIAPRVYRTSFLRLFLATIAMFGVFFVFYQSPTSTFLWALPISVTLLVWTLTERLLDTLWISS